MAAFQVGSSPLQRRESRVDIDLSYSGIERRRFATMQDRLNAAEEKARRDCFNPDRVISGLMPFDGAPS